MGLPIVLGRITTGGGLVITVVNSRKSISPDPSVSTLLNICSINCEGRETQAGSTNNGVEAREAEYRGLLSINCEGRETQPGSTNDGVEAWEAEYRGPLSGGVGCGEALVTGQREGPEASRA
eukprot:320573-Prorocentrum_minimum.AAC.1